MSQHGHTLRKGQSSGRAAGGPAAGGPAVGDPAAGGWGRGALLGKRRRRKLKFRGRRGGS